MHPRLAALQPYPFERLRALLADVVPPAIAPIRLSIGEPQHPTPGFIRSALIAALDDLAVYPTTAGVDALRQAIARAFERRFHLRPLDPLTQVLPVNGSREALFALAQTVVDASAAAPLMVSPNPFYQIYEGAALLAGAQLALVNQTRASGYRFDVGALPASDWARVQLVYVCSPGNPTGRVLDLDEWRDLFALSDRHGFVIASDECYADIYGDESAPPLGALEAAQQLGREGYPRLIVFGSLSKRSNAPGLRSGAVVGDASLIASFLRYRTYHGCAMSLPVQRASIAAWHDEAHVVENRTLYRKKFEALVPALATVLDVESPEAGFYLWASVPGGDDERFARDLYARTHVTVLPGQYLGRTAHGLNPGRGFVRMALVADQAHCLEAAERIVDFCRR